MLSPGWPVGFIWLLLRKDLFLGGEMTEASLLRSVKLTSAMCFLMDLGLLVRGFASTVRPWSSNQGNPDPLQESLSLATPSLTASLFKIPVTHWFYLISNWATFAAGTKQVTTSLIYLSGMNSSLTPALTEEFHRMTGGQPFPATDFCRLCLGCEGMTLWGH